MFSFNFNPTLIFNLTRDRKGAKLSPQLSPINANPGYHPRCHATRCVTCYDVTKNIGSELWGDETPQGVKVATREAMRQL